jgi:nitroreductase
MEKPAVTKFPIHELLGRRWSPRAFSSRVVSPQTLGSLFEAARWAPSSFNEQPWAYLVATKESPEEFQKLLSTLVEGNRAWAEHAPVLILSVAKKNFEQNGKPNRHAFYDAGQASMSLVIQATASGLCAHQMAGFSPEKARELFSIPPEWDPAAVIALGYAPEMDAIPEPFRAKELAPRSRKSLEDFVFSGKWRQTSSFVR